jgi:hypothetical protein
MSRDRLNREYHAATQPEECFLVYFDGNIRSGKSQNLRFCATVSLPLHRPDNPLRAPAPAPGLRTLQGKRPFRSSTSVSVSTVATGSRQPGLLRPGRAIDY